MHFFSLSFKNTLIFIYRRNNITNATFFNRIICTMDFLWKAFCSSQNYDIKNMLYKYKSIYTWIIITNHLFFSTYY